MIFAIFIAFWLVVTVFFYLFVYQFQDGQILTLNNTITEEKNKTQNIETFIDNYPDISKYEQEIQNKIDLLNMKLPNNDGMAEFLITLENTAKKVGIRISNIKPSAPANKANIAEYNMEIVIHGNYFQILNFLKALEDIPRFNIINTIDVQGNDQLLNARVILSIFQYGNVNTKSAAGAAVAQENKNKSDLLTGPRPNKPQPGVNI